MQGSGFIQGIDIILIRYAVRWRYGIIISMTKYLVLGLLLLTGCATTCPTVSEESISTCRAEKACGKGNPLTAIGMLLGGAGAGANGGRNTAADSYNSCIDRSLSAQRANIGLPDNTVHCTSTQVAQDQIKTDCH